VRIGQPIYLLEQQREQQWQLLRRRLAEQEQVGPHFLPLYVRSSRSYSHPCLRVAAALRPALAYVRVPTFHHVAFVSETQERLEQLRGSSPSSSGPAAGAASIKRSASGHAGLGGVMSDDNGAPLSLLECAR
jgi:hypothetical protein